MTGLAAALLLASWTSADAVTPRPASQIPDSVIMADWEDIELDALNGPLTQAAIQLYTQNGVKWARVRPEWFRVEAGSPGSYNFDGVDNLVNQLVANGTKVWMTLDGALQPLYASGNAPTNANGAMTPWLNWVGAMVSRYQGSVSAWEIWNEPNLTWPPAVNAAAYASLAQQTATKIRSLVPTAYIVLGGTSLIDIAWLQAVLPTTGNLINAVAIHPYRQYPEQAQDAFVSNSAAILGGGGVAPNGSFVATAAADYPGEIAKVRTTLSSLGFSNLAVWSGETGYPSQNEVKNLWPGSLLQQAKNLARLYVLNLGLGLPRTAWWRVFDVSGVVLNELLPSGQTWQDDYRNASIINAGFTFATFSPVYPQQGASIAVPASSFASQINISVTGSTITPTSPANLVTYNIPVPAGDYAVWLHTGSTSTVKPSIAACIINNSTFTAVGPHSYNYLAGNGLPAALQGQTDFTKFYYSPCSYISAFTTLGFYYPVHVSTSGTANLVFQLADQGTKVDEVRLSPIGTLTPKPAGTSFQTLASLFDDRVGRATNLGTTFQNGNLSAAQWSNFRSYAFVTDGGAPMIAYWVGQAPVDGFTDLSASLQLSAPIRDPILIDPLSGTYSSAGSGAVSNFSLRVQDYPLILASGSALTKTSSQIVLAEETYNFPNPVRAGQTTLRFYLTQPADVTLQLYNASHELVHSAAMSAAAGRNAYTWDVGNVANGVYFWRVTAGGQSVVKKILVLR